MRSLVLVWSVVALLGCKKQPKPDDDPPPVGSAKTTGHASFRMHGSDSGSGDVAAGSNTTQASAGSDGSGSGSAEDDGGKPAYRDEDGHVHGPGGPVFMGESTNCDATRDHCLRKSVWFAAGNIEHGRQFRAVPAFQFEKAWYTWRGEPVDSGAKLYKTKVVGKGSLTVGQPVIYFSSENDDTKWVDSEYESLTSSRWEAGVIESVNGEKVRISSWGDVPKDTIRVITETKSQ
ncbi:MAG TPA: hypothetical protein VGL61_19150 [Kofleriaceae bacterium]|jgi:hypothetical protein